MSCKGEDFSNKKKSLEVNPKTLCGEGGIRTPGTR